MTPDDPIVIDVDGQRVEGAFVRCYPNDIEVRITSPFGGAQAGAHVPYFARDRVRYTDADGALTAEGRERAEGLLAELYREGPGASGPVEPDPPISSKPSRGRQSKFAYTSPDQIKFNPRRGDGEPEA